MQRILFVLLAFSSLRVTAADFSGRVVNYSSYFIKAERLRHHRYELHLRHSSNITSGLQTVVDGRFRSDLTLLPEYGPYADLGSQVRRDEMNEAQARQLYIDYIGELAAVKVGLLQIDWVESLSPRTSDVLTPVDLRHGGSGAANEIIEPVFALTLNHQISSLGTIEWLVIPQGRPHRLPVARNGYGYYEALLGDSGNDDVEIVRERPHGYAKWNEYGLRYMIDANSWEYSLLGFHGHQRTPALRITPQDPTNATSIQQIQETFPATNTFGGSAVYGGDALVSRFFIYHDPKRQPNQFLAKSLESDTAANGQPILRLENNRQIYERRTKYGLGLDYVFSKHLKIYSEHCLTSIYKFYSKNENGTQTLDEEKSKNSFANSARFTNETFDDVLLSFDFTTVGPERGFSGSPQIGYTFQPYKISLGAYLFSSSHSQSTFETVKNADEFFFMIESYFDAANWSAKKSKTRRLKNE